MVYQVSHLQLRVHGTFGASPTAQDEYWSFGFRINIGSSDHTEAKKTAFLAGVQNAVNIYYSSALTKAHGSSYLQRLTCAYIGVDGRYEGGDTQPTTEYIYAAPVKGIGGTTQAWSNAMAVSMRTDIDRGPGSVGRFYVPSALAVGTGGTWSTTDVSDAKTASLTLVNAINTAARAQWIPSSAISVMSKVGVGRIGHVTHISVGRAPDTQRRRDNRLLEQHVWDAVATTAAFRDEVEAREYGQ